MDSRLHTAVRYGDEEAVEAALIAGLDPNQIGLLKWSPVHEAAHSGEREILSLLVKYKGDVDLQDDFHGNTPLHYAAKEDNSACVTVLLKAGARTDIKNKNGMTCFNVATPFCKDIIKDYVNQQDLPNEWRDDLNNNPGSKPAMTEDGKEGIPRVPEAAAIGHLHLSFEYHRTNLRIRVWQISDLLLPPPQISMIESIFVRSYLIPDEAKKTNRKTEDVMVEVSKKKDIPRKNAPLQNGIQHIFTPSSFRFETPLLYAGVTKAIVNERSVRIEVCMTQKHTHRVFLMAIVHMPLTVAIRRPIRERYPLIACMNYTIPNNMRVYSARDIILENAGGSRSSVEPLSRSNSSTCSSREDAGSSLSQKFISLDLSDSDDEGGQFAGVLEIQTSSPIKHLSPPSSRSHNQTSVNIPNDNLDTSDLSEVVTGRNDNSPSQDVSIDVNVGQTNVDSRPKRTKIIPNEIVISRTQNSKTFSFDMNYVEDSSFGSDINAIDQSKTKPSPRSTVVDLNNSQNDTVVDINKLQGDVILNVSSDKVEGFTSPLSNQEKLSSPTTNSGRKKKKIIPPKDLLSGLGKDTSPKSSDTSSNVNNKGEEGSTQSSESGCVYDDIPTDKRNMEECGEKIEQVMVGTNVSPHSDLLSALSKSKSETMSVQSEDGVESSANRNISETDESNANRIISESDETNSAFKSPDILEVPADILTAVKAEAAKIVPRRASSQKSLRLISSSEAGSEIGSATTSRPETPVWDFYDFADETGGEEGEGQGHAGKTGGVETSREGDDAASKALGTLQESILRLSRSTRLGADTGGVLETERVSGPVLPTVMIDEFEEMEDED